MLVFVLYLNNLPKRKQIHVYNCKNNHCLMENTVPLESSWSTEPHVHHISTPTQESKPKTSPTRAKIHMVFACESIDLAAGYPPDRTPRSEKRYLKGDRNR